MRATVAAARTAPAGSGAARGDAPASFYLDCGLRIDEPGVITMDEDTFNMQLRKFLKKVGITSQREIEQAVRAEIEQAVRAALDEGRLAGTGKLSAKMTLSVPALGLTVDVEDDIGLG
jgi:hypothetical protein